MSEKQQQPQAQQPHQQPIHQVQCDDCKRWPINGWAYRCGHCSVSLCQACILFTQHDPEHVFLLLKRPMDQRHKQERILGLTPYNWVDPAPKKPGSSPLAATGGSKTTPTFTFPGSGMTTCTFGNESSSNAPTLEHKKGPLFDRASELARPPETQSPFGMQQQPQGDQMTMDTPKPSFSFGEARSSSKQPFGFGD